jgi:hypothetical protein
VTLPGFGYNRTRIQQPDGSISTIVTATQCPLNFFNAGSNTLPCRRCPGGLVTISAGSRTTRSCMAGPGYLFDKMVAKACPRGTWKNTTNYATACTRCPRCLTTPTVASIHPSNCSMAAPGCYVVAPGAAGASCPRSSYNIGYNNATSCTLCEDRLVTLTTGSKSEASCLAPPGVGYDPAAIGAKAVTCPANSYKSGYNRQRCLSCGTGFLSPEGADSKQRCFVPIGHGTTRTAVDAAAGTTSVQKCLNGTFGHPVDTHGMFELPCRPCQDGMTTWDVKPGVEATTVTNVDTDSCFTLPGYGYQKKEQAAKQCEVGWYAAGWSKEPCLPCPDCYTTAGPGATSADQCVIAPGCYWDPRASLALPCDEGYYCLGGSQDANATVCPTGTTTRMERADSLAKCDGG